MCHGGVGRRWNLSIAETKLGKNMKKDREQAARRQRFLQAVRVGARAGGARYFAEPLEGRVMLSGVTLITHGFGSGITDWVGTMASAIAAMRPGNATIYAIKATDGGD